jgi:hypothetical protein
MSAEEIRRNTQSVGTTYVLEINLDPVPVHQVLTITVRVIFDFENYRQMYADTGSRGTLLRVSQSAHAGHVGLLQGHVSASFGGRPMPHLRVPEF